jgi:hypothetical protein
MKNSLGLLVVDHCDAKQAIAGEKTGERLFCLL